MTSTPVASLKPAAFATVTVKTTFEPTAGVASSTTFVTDSSTAAVGVVEAVAQSSSGREAQLPVRIHVEANNPAMGLYKRLGFRQIDTNGVYWLMEWRRCSTN